MKAFKHDFAIFFDKYIYFAPEYFLPGWLTLSLQYRKYIILICIYLTDFMLVNVVVCLF